MLEPVAAEIRVSDLPVRDPSLNRGTRLVCAWSGIASVVIFAIGFVAFAHWLPFPSPNDTARQVTADIVANRTGLRVGVIFMIIGFGLFVPFCAGVALELRHTEKEHPALTLIQIMAGGGGSAILALGPLFFGLIAFRAGQIPATTTQTLYDLGWFAFVMPYPVFSILLIAQGAAILRDRRDPPPFPRWAGFWCFLTAADLVPTGFIIFFKTGPLAWNGLIALYIPFVFFFGWIMILSYYLIRHVNRETQPA